MKKKYIFDDHLRNINRVEVLDLCYKGTTPHFDLFNIIKEDGSSDQCCRLYLLSQKVAQKQLLKHLEYDLRDAESSYSDIKETIDGLKDKIKRLKKEMSIKQHEKEKLEKEV
jgi:hypothetical protein